MYPGGIAAACSVASQGASDRRGQRQRAAEQTLPRVDPRLGDQGAGHRGESADVDEKQAGPRFHARFLSTAVAG